MPTLSSWMRLALAFCGMAIVVAAVIVSRCGAADDDETRGSAFSAIAWDEAPARRHAMLPDLLEKRPLMGLTRREVEELLGPPDQRRWSSLYPTPGYRIGTPVFGSDDTPLLVYFDETGCVEGLRAPALGLRVGAVPSAR